MSLIEESPFLRALKGEAVSPAPVWIMRQAGRYLPEYRATRKQAGSFLDLCYSPELATEVTLQPIRRFGFDAAILFSDILVIPWALGRDVRFEEGVGPRLDPIEDPEAVDRLEPELDSMVSRLEPVMEAVRRIRAALPAETPLIGFAGAPWTLATYMIAGRGTPDQAPAKLFAYAHPQAFEKLIRILEEAVVRLLAAQASAGVNALKIFDSWAGSLTPGMIDGASIAPLGRIRQALQAEAAGIPLIVFPRGVGQTYVRYDAEVAPDGLAIDQSVDMRWAARTLTTSKALQGNLDPVLMRAPLHAIDTDVAALREAMAGRAHILNLGHGVTPDSRIENVAHLLKTWRQ